MQADILTSESSLYQGEISQLQLTTSAGEITILPHHEAFAAILVPCTIQLKPKTGAERELEIGGGIVEVCDNQLRLLAVAISDDTKPASIESALKDAIDRANHLDQTIRDKQELGRATAVVDRSSASLGVATMKRRRRS